MIDNCKKCPLLQKDLPVSSENVISNLVSITDSMFDLFRMQPTSSDWPAESQKIVANLQIQFDFYKLELEKKLSNLP